MEVNDAGVTRRMRVVGWNVQPLVMSDDGEQLRDVLVQGVRITAEEWQAFKDGGDSAALESVRQQIEKAPAEPPASGVSSLVKAAANL